MEGTVVFDVVIGKGGEVENLGCDEYSCMSPAVLTRAAADAIRQWRWDALLLNGKPVRVRTKVAVKFVLDETSPPVSVCNVIRDPEWFNQRTINLSGTVNRVGGLKLLGSPDCRGSVVLADDSEASPPHKDDKYAAFQQAIDSPPVAVAVRGLFQHDKSPGELACRRLILERILLIK
jgi:Gram-negative bacterial TonB protein C-terminal